MACSFEGSAWKYTKGANWRSLAAATYSIGAADSCVYRPNPELSISLGLRKRQSGPGSSLMDD